MALGRTAAIPYMMVSLKNPFNELNSNVDLDDALEELCLANIKEKPSSSDEGFQTLFYFNQLRFKRVN